MKRIFFFTIILVACSLQAKADINPDNPISFEDPIAKAICVAHCDTNGDGEVSYAEAAVVEEMEAWGFYYNTQITTFNEYQYFINVKDGCSFGECWSLTSIRFRYPN